MKTSEKTYEELLEEISTLKNKISKLEKGKSDSRNVKDQVSADYNKTKQYLSVASIIMLAIGHDQKVIMINKKGCEILGYSESKIVGKNWFENFIPESNIKEIKSVFDQLMNGKADLVEYYENTIITKSGEEKIIAWHNSLLRDDQKRIIGTLSSGQDITGLKRTEKALKTSEEKYRKIFNNLQDLYYKADLKGIIEEISPSVTRLAGYKREELIGKPVYNVYKNPADRLEFARILGDKGSIDDFELILLGKNGEEIIVSTTSHLIFDEYEKAIGFEGVLRDITKRKKIETALQESEEKYSRIFESMTVGLAIVDFDGFIRDVNPAFCSIYGYSKEEAANKHTTKLLHKEFLYTFQEFFRPMREGDCFLRETIDKRKDGSKIILEVRGTVITVKKEKYILVILRDISARKQAQEKLNELQEYLHLQIEQMPIGLIVWDNNFRVRSWNPSAERIFGFTEKEVQGKHPYGLIVGKKVQPQVNEVWKRMLAGEETAHLTNENITRDSRTILCSWSNTSLKKSDGSLIGVLSMVDDITERKNAERTLLESENKYRTLTDNINIGIFRSTIGKKGRFIEVNPALLRMFGFRSKKMVMEMDVSDLYQQPGYRILLSNELSKKGYIKNKELTLRKRDGSTFIGSVSSVAVKDNQGNILYFDGMIEDISKRKSVLESLKSSEERLKILFESAPDAFYLLDLKGVLLDGNKAAEDMSGYKREELIGKNIFKIDLLPKSELPKAVKSLKQNIQGKGTGPEEFNLIHKNGKLVPVENITYPVNIENKTVILGIARDITERKMAESALQESEEKLRNIVESSTNVFYSHTPDHIITYISPQIEQFIGFSQEEALIKWIDLMSDDPINDTGYEITCKAIATGKSQPAYELEMIHKNGKKVRVEAREAPIVKNGKTIAIVGGLTDITESKLAEERIKKDLEEKNILLAEVHHRVKNNLQIISSLLKFQKGYSDDKNTIDVLTTCQNRVTSMAIIHQNLYEGKNFSMINLKHYVERLTRNLIATYRSLTSRVSLKFKVQEITININKAVPLALIMNELISNALKHAFPEGRKGTIIITGKKMDSDFLKISVADDGIGISRNIDLDEPDTLGLKLVSILSQQIHAEVNINRSNGTRISLKFINK